MERRERRRSVQEQYKLVMECRESGLTDYQWCVQNGIKPGTFHGWVNRLRRNYNFDITKHPSRLELAPTPEHDIVKLEFDKDNSTSINIPFARKEDMSAPKVSSRIPSEKTPPPPVIEIQALNMSVKISNYADPVLVGRIIQSIGGIIC